MKKSMNALIQWLKADENGRKTRMRTHVRYCPRIVFDGDENSNDSWSAAMVNIQYIKEYTTIAILSFLSEKAPFEKLRSGETFCLYEGDRLVAKGEIMDFGSEV